MNEPFFQYPWALALLLLIPCYLYWKRRHRAATSFSAVALICPEAALSCFKHYAPDFFESMFLGLVVLAIANFQYSSVWRETYRESKWIMIVQDLSGSMNRASTMGNNMTIGDVTLEGARAFIDMREKDDLIGIAAFSSYAKLISPPTFDKTILKEKLNLLNRKQDSIVFREMTVGGATNASYAAWLALNAFFMLLPEENQLSFAELKDLRFSLLGKTMRRIRMPKKLEAADFGHGMAIVMFTDGRIESNKSEDDVRKGLPNFVNVVKLIKHLGVNFYFIVAGGEVNGELKDAIELPLEDKAAGRIFYAPKAFDIDKIKAVYRKIHEMEKNRLLVKLSQHKKETRQIFAITSFLFLIGGCFFHVAPGFRKL